MIFTGSVVVDSANTSGFCVSRKPCMVAIYTGHTPAHGADPALQTQNIAFSNDRGRTWTRYSGNPVLNLRLSDFRDPNVFWSDKSSQWIMAVSFPNEHKIRLYGSSDLKHWRALSDFGPAGATNGQWECPDLFEVPVENSRETRWVLKIGLNPGALQGGSGEQYFIGAFDGTRFLNENAPSLTLWTDYGKDCYCALTFNNLPPARAPMILGWMDNWQYAAALPTAPWRGQMTVPRKLSLRKTPEGLRLIQQPAAELQALRSAHWQTRATPDKINRALRDLPVGQSFDLDTEIPLGSNRQIGWNLVANDGAYTSIGYDRAARKLFVDRTHSGLTGFSNKFPARTEAPLTLSGDSLHLQILVDRCSVEVFADHGRIAMTNLIFPPSMPPRPELWTKGGEAGEAKVDLTQFRSAWSN